MQKANFEITQIAEIVKKLRLYKKLTVTTTGQMFINENDAKEAVRTVNAIRNDENLSIGIVTLTEDMVNDDKLKMYAKNPKVFNLLFKDAVIPVAAKTETEKFERKTEEVKTDTKVEDGVDVLLGLKTVEEETKTTETK